MKDFKKKYRSQSNRLPEFDYRQGFWYYITICTKDMISYFGKIVDGKMRLNKNGRIADEFWKELPKQLSVTLDEFVIMPNHMHGIIILEEELRRDLIHQISAESPNNNTGDFMNEVSTDNWILMKQEGLHLGKVIRHYKAKVSRVIRMETDKNFKWQSNYYDHIIRNQQDLERIRYYIKNNPLKWEIDKYYNL